MSGIPDRYQYAEQCQSLVTFEPLDHRLTGWLPARRAYSLERGEAMAGFNPACGVEAPNPKGGVPSLESIRLGERK